MKKEGYAFPVGIVLPFVVHFIMPTPRFSEYDVWTAVIGGLFIGLIFGLYCFVKVITDKGDGRGLSTLLLASGVILGQTSLFIAVMGIPLAYALIRCAIVLTILLLAYSYAVKKRRQKSP